ncbi:protein ADP-ribosylarginine hydrolase-like [Megalops cyprinoides]|uniref:protein ADP-ribosylarginine hydrolase-like n=1 Tax=Megalops cyprinoides TaxID=118141 RepID=UPI001864D94B|nr:protein ADP-ribosylarginine hydrolase-like [Megalops cyprinoides]
MAEMEQRYVASMVLSGAGDAMGYHNGDWEFCNSGETIHKELALMGGLTSLNVTKLCVSDDTVMHLATAEAVVEMKKGASISELFQMLAQKYKDSMRDMDGRAPGVTCMNSVHLLRPKVEGGWKIPFNHRGGGCGAAMRAMCVGLRFPEPSQEDLLVAVSVESGRITHHHPTGYLGALAAALFTAYAVRGKPPLEWGRGLLDILEKAKEYIKQSEHCVEENLEKWDYFETAWRNYLQLRGILDGKSKPQFPESYGVKERDVFYKSLSYSGIAGSSGHDAPMIAYDALLIAGSSWVELAHHAFFHGGDSDSTAVIAAAWWGAIYGFEGVPEANYKKLEYRKRLASLAQKLYEIRDKPFPLQRKTALQTFAAALDEAAE